MAQLIDIYQNYVYNIYVFEYLQTGRNTTMRKNFGSKTWLYPMPVLISGTKVLSYTYDAWELC